MQANVKRLIKYIGDRKLKYFTILILTLILEASLQYIFSFLNKSIFNSIEYNDVTLFKTALVIAIVYIILQVCTNLMRYLSLTQTRHIVFKIKNDMFKKLTSFNMNYFDQGHSSDTIKKLNSDANMLKDAYFSTGFWVLRNLFNGIVAIVLMFTLSYKLALFSIIFSIITLNVTIKLNKLIYAKHNDLYQHISKLSRYIADILSGFLIIKIYDNNNFIRKKYLEENETVKDGLIQLTKYDSLSSSSIFLLSMLGEFGTIFMGIFLVKNGQLDYGTLMAVMALQGSMSYLIMNFTNTLSSFSYILSVTAKVFDFLEMDTPLATQKDDLKLDLSKGIEINNLSFAYKDRDAVLNDFTFSVDPNEKVMLCGSSGSGKSTILKLLLRFYEDYDGEIKIFGNDLKDYSTEQLYDLITYIPQNNFLFDATILENIKFANEDATFDEIKKASDDAFATEFITCMPDGFDTVVVNGGTNISGGERQRIAIARAFVKDSPIILMDEPTSSLDNESESKINLAMVKLIENKIVIMVTHKKTNVEHFDRIINM